MLLLSVLVRSGNLTRYAGNASKPIGWMAVLAAALIVVVMTFPTSSPIRACKCSPFCLRRSRALTEMALKLHYLGVLSSPSQRSSFPSLHGNSTVSSHRRAVQSIGGSTGIECIGSSHYSGPIRSITKWSAGAEIDLQSTLKDGAAGRKRVEEDIFKFGDSASEIVSQDGIHPN